MIIFDEAMIAKRLRLTKYGETMKLMNLLIILFLGFFGCTEQKTEVAFDCIDYSCYAGNSKSIKYSI